LPVSCFQLRSQFMRPRYAAGAFASVRQHTWSGPMQLFQYASAQTRARWGRYPVPRPAVHPPTPAATGPILERAMSIGTILLILVILILIGVLPTWPHAKSWGYGPSGGVGLVVVILAVLLVMGRL